MWRFTRLHVGVGRSPRLLGIPAGTARRSGSIWPVRGRPGSRHRVRGVFADGMTFAHLIEALDGVLRRLGGTPRSWRTDRMATVVYPGTDRLRPEAAAAAKHYGVTIAVCPPLRPQRKGVVEKAIDYVTQSWWRSAPVDAGGGAGRPGPLDGRCFGPSSAWAQHGR
jgi:hypothetical protein